MDIDESQLRLALDAARLPQVNATIRAEGATPSLPMPDPEPEVEVKPSVIPDAILGWLLGLVPALDEDLQDRALYVRQLQSCRGGANCASENARKALLHWRMKYNELEPDRRSVEAALAESVEELRPTLVKVLDQSLRVALLEADLQRALAAEARHRAQRGEDERTGLYSSARNVVDRLHEDFGIAEGHWFAVSETGLAVLNEMLKQESARAGHGSPLKPALRNKRRAKRSR